MFNITGERKQISLQENIFIKKKHYKKRHIFCRKFDINFPLLTNIKHFNILNFLKVHKLQIIFWKTQLTEKVGW